MHSSAEALWWQDDVFKSEAKKINTQLFFNTFMLFSFPLDFSINLELIFFMQWL